jgi:hypothetical protein
MVRMIHDHDTSAVQAVLGAALARGIVQIVGPDGTVVVADAPDRWLDVLTTASGELRVVPGDEVVYWLPEQPNERGVVFGRIGESASPASPAVAEERPEPSEQPRTPDTLVLEARSGLTLRVGDASIEIRADGKILIKGTDLVSHAKRMNRIKGGAVAIN